MRMDYFPGCCTLKILSEFGGTEAADHIIREQSAGDIKEAIEICMETIQYQGLAAMVITSNNEQIMLNSVLRDMDFKHTKWMKKTMHCTTKVRMWWKEVN